MKIEASLNSHILILLLANSHGASERIIWSLARKPRVIGHVRGSNHIILEVSKGLTHLGRGCTRIQPLPASSLHYLYSSIRFPK